MENLGFIVTVCALAFLAGQVNAQCPAATLCFNNLGFNMAGITPGGSDAVILQAICRKYDQILQCYDVLLQCTIIAPAVSVLPTHQQMQTATQTLCKDQTLLEKGFKCLGRQHAYRTEVQACAVHLWRNATSITHAQLAKPKALYCSLFGKFFTCFTSISSMKRCDSKFSQALVVFANQLLPTDCQVSGSPKLTSWLFVGVTAALIALRL